jgi:hypothetical protein
MLGSGLHCIVRDDYSGPSDRLLASPHTIPGPLPRLPKVCLPPRSSILHACRRPRGYTKNWALLGRGPTSPRFATKNTLSNDPSPTTFCGASPGTPRGESLGRSKPQEETGQKSLGTRYGQLSPGPSTGENVWWRGTALMPWASKLVRPTHDALPDSFHWSRGSVAKHRQRSPVSECGNPCGVPSGAVTGDFSVVWAITGDSPSLTFGRRLAAR